MHSKLPPLISVIGSDGSGKSTVCEHLITYIEQYGPAAMVHLGKQAGNVERVVVKFPFMGRLLKRKLIKIRSRLIRPRSLLPPRR